MLGDPSCLCRERGALFELGWEQGRMWSEGAEGKHFALFYRVMKSEIISFFVLGFSELEDKISDLKDKLEETYLRLDNGERRARTVLLEQDALKKQMQNIEQNKKNTETQLQNLLDEIDEA